MIENKLKRLHDAKSEAFNCLVESVEKLCPIYLVREISDIHSWLCSEYVHTLTFDLKNEIEDSKRKLIQFEYNKFNGDYK